MELAISVIAYNKPNYLQIFLHSLSFVGGIEKYPIFIYFDFCSDDKIRQQHIEVVNRFSKLNIKSIFRNRQYKILLNVTNSYRETFEQGFDEVLMFESDIIMRRDIFQYLSSIPRDAFFYNLMGNKACLVTLYRGFGNLLERENFDILYKWVIEKKFVGRPTIQNLAILDEHWGHDAIFSRFLVDHELKTRFSDKFYVAHIGVEGIHIRPRNDEEQAVSDMMFEGSYNCWFPQAIKIIEKELYPESLKTTLKPRGFRYE